MKHWNEEIWKSHYPPEEYDYEANGEEEPTDVDIDSDTPDPHDYELAPEEVGRPIREIMEHRIELFKQELRDGLL